MKKLLQHAVLGLLLFCTNSANSQNIIKAEYFFNADPGFGNGTGISLSASADISNLTFSADINSLPVGINRLFVRSQDANGIWSITNVSLFYKAAKTTSKTVVKVEYFIDDDPGFGNGLNIPVTSGNDVPDVTFNPDLSSVTVGIHRLFVRSLDSEGNWSVSRMLVFYKASLTASPVVNKVEYFFDTDPGFGNGINVPISSGTDVSNVTFMPDITSLPVGVHRLFIRSMDNTGNWSISQIVVFYRGALISNPNITGLEYFFDADPGFGNGTSLTVSPSSDIQDAIYNINVSSLSSGAHKLFIRSKDNAGSWSITNISDFNIDAAPQVNLSVSSNTGTEAGATAITVTATASQAVTGNQTVTLGVNGTGITSGDYTLSNTTITILSGQTTGSVTFTVVDDAVVEGSETATLTISNPSSGITLGSTTTQNVSIADNDFPTVSLSVSPNSGTEAGATAITVTATASQAVTGNQTVTLGVSGTGITSGDYTLSNTTITILSGQTTGSVTFTVVDDAVVEGSETATLTISNPSSGITLGSTTTQNVSIADNDFPTVNLSVSSNTGTEAGATAITVTATASQAVTGNQTVTLSISGTGITSGDYTLSNTTITILNGQATGSVTFTVVDDAMVEGSETATLTISNPSSGIALGSTTTQNISITDNDVANANNPPVITSSGGGTTGNENIPENTTFVVAVAATGQDAGSTLAYSIVGGVDQNKFTINATTGVLSFITAPDFEVPTDFGADNIYVVTVRASDGTLNDDQTIAVSVRDINDNAPVITSNGGGTTASRSIPENTTAVTTMTATDADANTTMAYSIAGGADQSKFSINPTTGALSFITAPDFEQPTDTDANNTYVVTVRASDGTLSDEQTMTVTVTDVSESSLPANLVNVKAYQKASAIQVEWTSVTEINVDKYEVEKSTDGQSFTILGTVQARGNSTSQVNYSLPDHAAQSGSNYYRIKSIDNNGAVQYSSVVRVNVEKGNGAITIYPNPVTTNTISLQLNNLERGKYTVTLTNKLGQQLYSSVIEHNGGSSTQTLRINSSLPKGTYQLQVIGGEVKMTKQLIKR
ncbi:MAG TPA: cadherin domain-containing protein [Segetibacter sp.]